MMLEAKSLPVRTNYLVLAVVALYLISQLFVQFFPGQGWKNRNLYFFLAGIQIFIIFLPAVYFTYRQKLEPVVFFHIRRFTVPEGLLIIVMAAASSYIASVLNTFVVFFLEKAGPVKVDGIPAAQNLPELWMQIFVIALLPAVCEEFFFRGIIFRVFEGLGTRLAIGISAFYFALFHFDIRNLLGPLFLGLMITWYCYRTNSIFAGVLAHFINNLLAVLAGWFSRNEAGGSMLLTRDTIGQMLIFACFTAIVLVILIKAFEGITKGKVHKEHPVVHRLPGSIFLHWPICFFYGTYLVISILFLASLSNH